jgi:hypothetical protein
MNPETLTTTLPGPLPAGMQLTIDGRLHHFLTIEGLPRELLV